MEYVAKFCLVLNKDLLGVLKDNLKSLLKLKVTFLAIHFVKQEINVWVSLGMEVLLNQKSTMCVYYSTLWKILKIASNVQVE